VARPAAGPNAAAAAGARRSWRRCVNHPQAPSSSVCPSCEQGYCWTCERKVQTAVVCPGCDGLCVPSARHDTSQQTRELRSRSMGQELRTISGYPLVDGFAFVLLALFTWFFGLFKGWNVLALLFSNGLLMMYSFAALSKVSGGNMDEYMPDFTDVSDLARPLRLGFAALVVSAGPMFAVVISVPAAALLVPGLMQDSGAEPSAELASLDEAEGSLAAAPPLAVSTRQAVLGTGLLALFALTLVWKILYTPVALTVAALTRSFWQTLNPVLGVETIFRMGRTYWQAAAIYTAIAAVQWGLGLALGLIPIAGGLVGSFVDAYACLAIGCTLGLAVYKKAPELGLD
jgi:hypothetical protein